MHRSQGSNLTRC